jgi:hypothetical protein
LSFRRASAARQEESAFNRGLKLNPVTFFGGKGATSVVRPSLEDTLRFSA